MYTQEVSTQMTNLALKSLRAAGPKGIAGEALFDLTRRLLVRQN